MTVEKKKTLYGIASAAAPISGVACGILCGILVAVQDMYEPIAEELAELKAHAYIWTEAVHIISEEGLKDFIGIYGFVALALMLLFVASLVTLCILTGSFNRNEDGCISMNLFDRIWTEVQLATCGLAAIGAVGCAVPYIKIIPMENRFDFYKAIVINKYVFDPIGNNVMLCISGLGMLICIELAVLCFVSMIKKLKARTFLESSVIVKIAKAIWHVCGRVINRFTVPSDNDEKAGAKLMRNAVVLMAVMIVLAMSWIGVIIDIAIVIVLFPKVINKYMDIRKGVSKVKAGDLDYKIEVERDAETGKPKTEFDRFAEDINQIAEATNTAVQNELKNQRMKTDLISNVSHDLKTPLTSMISYLDILKKEGLDSPNAEEYLNIVNEKTHKLKTLTEDLFEAAKASSGNIPCEIQTINLNQMLEQELAEFGDIFEDRNLEVIRKTEAEDTNVLADGKLLSRVIENLLGNIKKYALEGSRVYIDVLDETPTKLRLDIKNISRDQLNISPEELMERFTRGDASRNTEGSGLGLAIAKDLTSLMGGLFEITIDGDMFKASVVLNKR